VADYFHNYTDNSEPQFIEEEVSVPANDWQENPVVSYGFTNDFYETIAAYIVWEGGWASALPAGTGGKTIVGVSIDDYGNVDANACLPLGKLYKMVPDDAGSSSYDPYETYNPSIAGRHSSSDLKMVVAWWENTNLDIFKKDFYWCDVSFRQPISVSTNPLYLESKNNIVYPNPTNGQIAIKLNQWKNIDRGSLEIFDLTGRRISITKGTKNSLERNSRNLFQSLRAGIYILRARNETGMLWTQK